MILNTRLQYTGIGLMWLGTKIIASELYSVVHPPFPGVAKQNHPECRSLQIVCRYFRFVSYVIYTRTSEITRLAISFLPRRDCVALLRGELGNCL